MFAILVIKCIYTFIATLRTGRTTGAQYGVFYFVNQLEQTFHDSLLLQRQPATIENRTINPARQGEKGRPPDGPVLIRRETSPLFY